MALRAIRVSESVLAELLRYARQQPEQECCGLLAGRGPTITRIFPAANVAADPAKNYEIGPKELFAFMRQMRAEDVCLMGIFHSHPNGTNEPSPGDIERAYYPDAAYFVISPHSDSAVPVRAFSMRDGQVEELEIRTK